MKGDGFPLMDLLVAGQRSEVRGFMKRAAGCSDRRGWKLHSSQFHV